MEAKYGLTIEQRQGFSLTPGIIMAIHILQFNNQELNEYISKELLENPLLEVEREAAFTSQAKEYSFDIPYEDNPSLHDFLLSQLRTLELDNDLFSKCEYIISNIDERGYLILDSIESHPLQIVQAFDPPGVGARNLTECLHIQLKRLGFRDNDPIFRLTSEIKDIHNLRLKKLFQELDIEDDDAKEYLKVIRSLNPMPGLAFGNKENVQYIVPDVYVKKTGSGLKTIMKERVIPSLKVSSYYKDLIEKKSDDKELDDYLRERLESAMHLIRSIDQRQKTIEAVSREVVNYQSDYFYKGDKYLKPLTLKLIAGNLGIHESTVSRAINGKYLDTGKKVLELKSLFSNGINCKDGAMSQVSIKAHIKEIIANEDLESPLSDKSISERLLKDGISVSRRTVTKYRMSMGIPSSSIRKNMLS